VTFPGGSVGSSPYREHPVHQPVVTEVLPDERRRFVVLSGTRSLTGEPWTLVLEYQDDVWVSRRDLKAVLGPEASVSGYLFDRDATPDPVALLRRMNELVRTEYYRVLREKMAGDQERNAMLSELARLREQVDVLRLEERRRRLRHAGRGSRREKSALSRRRRHR
jgi:hypothetical protein